MPATQITTNSSTGNIPTLGVKEWFTTGDVYFLDSNNGSDTNNGLTSSQAVATLAVAVALTTANQNDVILVMPGHAETIAAETTISTEGISIIGLGNGDNRPVITFGTATAAGLTIAADNVTIKNVVFKNDIDSQVEMMDIADAAYTHIDNCQFLEGSSKQYLIGISITNAGADYCKITHCTFISKTAGAGSAINIGAAVDNLEVGWCNIYGDWSDAGIHSGSAHTNCDIHDNYIENDQTGDHAIQFTAAATGAIRNNGLFADALATVLDPGSCKCINNHAVNAIDIGSSVVPVGTTADDFIGRDNSNNAAATTNVAANEDGSVLERLEQLQEAINKGSGTALAANESIVDVLYATNGIGTFPAGAAPANNVSMAEVLRDIWDAVRNGTGGAEPATNRGIMDYLGATPAFFAPGLGFTVTKTCDLAGANDDLFDVTGKVFITMIAGEVTTVLSGAESFQLRVKTDNVALCAATTITTDADGTHYLLTGDFGDAMCGGSTPGLRAAERNSLGGSGFVLGDASGSAVIESNTTGNGGAILFTLCYIPLEAGASVSASA